MGDLLSFAYPEMLKVIFPNKLEAMSEATVKVKLQLRDKQRRRVYGRITMRIRDKHCAYFRVWRFLFTRTKKMAVRCFNSQLELPRSVVAVPSGWALDVIKVDLRIETDNSDNKVNNLKGTLNFDNGGTKSLHDGNGTNVDVTITLGQEVNFGEGKQHFQPQLSGPVEVEMMRGHPTIVYTIGDELSFTEFIMTLRRILADHPNREDLLDGYDMLNLSSTREHPVLAKQTSLQPARWLHVRLQVADDDGELTSWTTLIMRDDSLYILGFMNQKGYVYGLVDKYSDGMLPEDVYRPHRLEWSVEYKSILGLGKKDKDQAGYILLCARLGCDFAKKAVCHLSWYGLQTPADAGGGLDVEGVDPNRLALAGLIVMVCESARMNPIHDAFAAEWRSGSGFNKEMMKKHMWQYGDKSRKLRIWKSREYAKPFGLPHPIEELQTIHLVLNVPVAPEANSRGSGHGTGGGGNSRGRGSGGGRGGGVGGGGRDGNNRAGEGGIDGGGDDGGGSGGGGADENKGSGRARVALFAMCANLKVVGTKIIVFDGKRGQIIYTREEEQGQGEMINLELTGPYKGISAYGPFSIKIDIPGASPITWEWDCYDPKRIAEVDEPPKTEKFGDGRAEVTYAVMSDALEATVQVKLAFPEGHKRISIHGEVTALIDGFNGSKSFLFKRRREAPLRLHASGESCFILSLARDLIAVPCGKVLHIKVDLQIIEEPSKTIEANLTFHNGRCIQVNEDKDVQVNISWYPEQTSEDIGEQEVITTPEPSHHAETKIGTARSSHQPEQTSEMIHEHESGIPQESRRPAKVNVAAIPEPSRTTEVEIIEQIDEHQLLHRWKRWKLDTIGVGLLRRHRWILEERIGKQDFSATTTTTPPKLSSPSETEMSTAQMSKEISDVEFSSLSAEVKRMPGVNIVVCPIGDALSFVGCIMALRRAVAGEYSILGDHNDRNLHTEQHLVIDTDNAKWLDIGLQVAGEEETSSATLFVEGDNLDCLGFMNQKNVCYKLSNPEAREPPPKVVVLDWGGTDDYQSILDSVKLSKTFAMNAVRVLSSYPDPVAGVDMNARLAVVGLSFMYLGSAKMNRICEAVTSGWNTGTGIPKELMYRMMFWELISIALLNWSDHGYRKWVTDEYLDRLLRSIGVKSEIDALHEVHFVRNFLKYERELLLDYLKRYLLRQSQITVRLP